MALVRALLAAGLGVVLVAVQGTHAVPSQLGARQAEVDPFASTSFSPRPSLSPSMSPFSSGIPRPIMFEYSQFFNYPGNNFRYDGASWFYTIDTAAGDTVESCKWICWYDRRCLGFNVADERYCNFKNKLENPGYNDHTEFYKKL
jgi:hypothetical protein